MFHTPDKPCTILTRESACSFNLVGVTIFGMGREIDQVKEKIDLVEFLKGYIDLKPAGRNLKALCPFHQEKTPSFVVSPDRGRWRCFGACGEGGDVFTFLMKHENLEFHEALKVLAERAGVPLRQLDPRQQREFGVLYDINAAANEFYQDRLKDNAAAREYVASRGVTEETVLEFGFGYAPGGEALVLHLLDAGYDISAVVRAGLAKKNERGLYRDALFGRVTFPMYNSVGKVVAFTGRILPSVAERLTFDMPKYLNSPETPIFNKSKILYGFHLSKQEIAKLRTVFIVEGQMDVVMAWQSGVRNVVAVSGTGLTAHHLEKLRRSADTAIVSFDNDEAGMKALERSLDVFSPFDFHVKVVDLGEYGDPADACQADPNFLSGAIECAVPAFRYLFETLFAPVDRADIPARKRLVARLLSKIKSLKSAMEQEVWLEELARVSGVSGQALQTEFATVKPPASAASRVGEDGAVRPREVSAGALDRRGKIAERLFLLAYAHEDFFSTLREYREFLPEGCCVLLDTPSDARGDELRMRASHECADVAHDELRAEFHDLLKHLKCATLMTKQDSLRMQIRAGGDDTSRVMEEFYSVSKELDGLRV